MPPGPSLSPAEAFPVPAATGSVTVTAPELDRRTTRKLQKVIDNVAAKKDIAGMQVAVRLPSGETWVGSAGQAEYDPDRAIHEDTQFAIASVTKTFVAALILRLVQEGKIDLDKPYGRYFRNGPRKDNVTVRQLLSHTSGIDDFWSNPRYGRITTAWFRSPDASGLNARSHRWTFEEMMDLVRAGSFKPGKGYRYSNTNYVLLGKVAEAVAGAPIAEQLRRRFFDPLGLQDTVYQPDEKPRPDAAHGHWRSGNGFVDHTRESDYVPFMAAASVAGPAGAIASSARDLATWADALYGGDVLSSRLQRQMTTMLSPGFYGLGTDVAIFAGQRAYGHRGGIRGYESAMWYLPDSGVSIALLSNHGNWYTQGITTDVPVERIVKAVLRQR
jgi:D-alanyl-D-alanine carboxypeptidase